MTRLTAKALAILLLMTLAACSGQARDTPLLGDLRRFCVDTALSPDAVRAAAATAGAKRPGGSAGSQASMTWDHAIGGRIIHLRLTTPPGEAGAAPAVTCTLSDDQDAGASLAAVRAWLGAPAGDGNFEQYYFTMAGAQPHYVPRERLTPVRARTLSGGLYRLSLASFNGSTALTLQH